MADVNMYFYSIYRGLAGAEKMRAGLFRAPARQVGSCFVARGAVVSGLSLGFAKSQRAMTMARWIRVVRLMEKSLMVDKTIEDAQPRVNMQSPFAFSSAEERALYTQERIDLICNEVSDPMLRTIMIAAVASGAKDAGILAGIWVEFLLTESKGTASEKASS
jgi:hypothetical protein